MLISHKYKFIFIHIPRTAGTSIEKSLCRAIQVDNWVEFTCHPKEVLNRLAQMESDMQHLKRDETGRIKCKHIRAKDLKLILGDGIWNSYFKFAFVRNPWDRSVSMYFKKKKESSDYLKSLLRNDKFFFGLGLRLKYILHIIRKGARTGSQFEYVSDDNGRILVDFIGRFENLNDDFNSISNRLGVNATMVHHDKTKHQHYSKYYDGETKELLARRKWEDIVKFDYSFDHE